MTILLIGAAWLLVSALAALLWGMAVTFSE
jgi:hypothetical protein